MEHPVDIGRRDLLALLIAAPVPFFGQTNSGLTRDEILYGGLARPAQQMLLRAGPLSMVFEPELAFLRYVKYHDTEILRGLYAAVRDRNWGTVPPKVSGLRLEQQRDRFLLRFEVDCSEGPIRYRWQGTLAGEPDGTLRFDFAGIAGSNFARNRIGFCVLHGPGVAGQPVKAEKVSGEVSAGRFPSEISPNQPFFDLRALTHPLEAGLEAEVRMTGDTFEMEDQRNWTDASYKTYCTPLATPFPAEVKAGDGVQQSVVMRLKGTPRQQGSAPDRTGVIELKVGANKTMPVPALGLGISSAADSLSASEIARLKKLALSHLRADVKLSESDFARVLGRAAGQARALGVSLELAIHLDRKPEEELKALALEIGKTKAPVHRYLVFHKQEKSTTAKWMEMARKHLGQSGAKFASGTDAYFTELNRGRPPLASSDMVTYSINPQVHAFDNLSLVETLEMQAVTLASARAFCGSLPVVVSPVTLKPRFNPNATAGTSLHQGPLQDLPQEVDARQPSLFAAAWTLGSLKYLTDGGASSATFYETTGWRGVMETAAGSKLPQKFPSRAGTVFPLYHVLAGMAGFTGGEMVPVVSSSKMEVEAVLLRKSGKRRLMVANLTDQPRVVRVPADLGAAVRVRMLDEYSAQDAMRKPEEFLNQRGALRQLGPGVLQLALLSYAIAFVDSE
ncbi:MAG: hypothetical protein JJE04_13975 [Acidobacteriia bacterium]|nr:hypothetical protein [Terriglobia bacterium]